MQGYGWTEYDTRTGGSQMIRDAELHIDLKTQFLKSDDGNSWSVRLVGTPRPGAPDNLTTTVIFHTAIEKADSDSRILSCGASHQKVRRRQNAEAECHGEVPGLGPFEISVTMDIQGKPVYGTDVHSLDVDEEKIWQAKCMNLPMQDCRSGTETNGVCVLQLFSSTKSKAPMVTLWP